MRHILCMVFMFSVVNCTFDQFITVGYTNHRTQRTACDNSSKSTLVEQFFDLIFNEFHSNPPVCVCVQMCLNQPTYCYPNGCLKRADSSKNSGVVLPVTRANDYANPIVIVDKKNDFIHDLLNKNYNTDEFYVQSAARQGNVIPVHFRPDPFNNKYRIFLKHKMPKMELKYNIGEQMKNTKPDFLKYENFDVSKTRWPVNKINHVHFSKKKMNTNVQKRDSSNLNLPAFNEKIDRNQSSRYFKRELVNGTTNNTNENGKQEHVKSETDDNTYSLEQIIDGLIDKIDLEAELNETAIEINNRTSETTETIVTESSKVKQAGNEHNPKNNTAKVTSMILTNITIDEIKYNASNSVNSTNEISKEVANLSKKIEIQNEMDLQMIRLVVGNVNLTTENKETIEFITTEKATKVIKGRQRIVRKLQNSKNN